MRGILLSIKPEFGEMIICGKKRYEYRRRLCNQPIDCMYLYVTAPVKKVVAKVVVSGKLSGEKEWIWNQTKNFAGIDKCYFDSYFSGRMQAGAYCLGNVEVYKQPLELKDMGIPAAPQSFVYLSEEQVVNL